jgi:hypothetical protein
MSNNVDRISAGGGEAGVIGEAVNASAFVRREKLNTLPQHASKTAAPRNIHTPSRTRMDDAHEAELRRMLANRTASGRSVGVHGASDGPEAFPRPLHALVDAPRTPPHRFRSVSASPQRNDPRSDGSEAAAHPLHALNVAQAALRICRFAADSVERVVDLAHLTEAIRECVLEFGIVDATLPAAMRATRRCGGRNALADRYAGWTDAARDAFWLASRVVALRLGAPMPDRVLQSGVAIHDVQWCDRDARRCSLLAPTHDGFGVTQTDVNHGRSWAQGAVGVSSGAHWFSVALNILAGPGASVAIGWVDARLISSQGDRGDPDHCTGGAFSTTQERPLWTIASVRFEKVQLGTPQSVARWQRTVSVLLDCNETPARLRLFVDDMLIREMLVTLTEGLLYHPSVMLRWHGDSLRSNHF